MIKKIFSLFAAILFAGSMMAVDYELVYTLTPEVSSASGSSAYATAVDIPIDGITWNVMGNTTMVPWRIGGKNLNGVDRSLYSKTAIEENIAKIEITHAGASSVTVNSMTVVVATNSNFAEASIVSTLTPTFDAGGTVTVTRPEGKDWSNCYYKITYNVTIGSSNKFIAFSEAKFSAEKDASVVKTLKSIEISGMTTEFETVDEFAFDGVCTATYTVVKGGVPQADEVKAVTPTSVTEPDMTIPGEKEITVSFTDGEVTKEAKYTITVTEHEVIPGTYDVELNNVFFGTTVNAQITKAVSATYKDITAELSWIDTPSNKPRTDATYVRFYTDNTLTLSVPAGYKMTSIVFTTEDDYGKPTPNIGAFDSEDTKKWTGEATWVTFVFSVKSFVDKATVTFAPGIPTSVDNTVDGKKAVKFIENGQLFIELNGRVYNVQGQTVK